MTLMLSLCMRSPRVPGPQHLWPCSHSTVSTSKRALDCSAASHERAAASARIDSASSALWSCGGGTGTGGIPSRRRLRVLCAGFSSRSAFSASSTPKTGTAAVYADMSDAGRPTCPVQLALHQLFTSARSSALIVAAFQPSAGTFGQKAYASRTSLSDSGQQAQLIVERHAEKAGVGSMVGSSAPLQRLHTSRGSLNSTVVGSSAAHGVVATAQSAEAILANSAIFSSDIPSLLYLSNQCIRSHSSTGSGPGVGAAVGVGAGVACGTSGASGARGRGPSRRICAGPASPAASADDAGAGGAPRGASWRATSIGPP